MNNLCMNRCLDILASFKSDSTGRPNTSAVRREERYDSHISYFDDWYDIITVEGLREERYYKIYNNSFSGKRNRFDEPGQIILCIITNVQKRIRMVGKTFITDRDIYFKYDGIAGSWDVGYKTYNAYKDREGETIKCYLITYTYEDGSTKVKLVAKEDYDG